MWPKVPQRLTDRDHPLELPALQPVRGFTRCTTLPLATIREFTYRHARLPGSTDRPALRLLAGEMARGLRVCGINSSGSAPYEHGKREGPLDQPEEGTMADMLRRIIVAAGTCLLVGGAPIAATAQTAPETTAAVVAAPVATPQVRLDVGEREASVILTSARRAAAPDPLSNGVRNGAIVGAIGAGTVFGIVAGRSCEDRLCTVGVPLIWAGIGAGCGALAGLAIDRARSASSTPRGLSAVVAPVLSRRHKELGVAIRW
jgi:hypothetical protein